MVTCVRYQSPTSKSLIGNELNILHRVHYGWHHVTDLCVTQHTHKLRSTTQRTIRRTADTCGPEVCVHTIGCNYYHCCETQCKPSADERHRKGQHFSRGRSLRILCICTTPKHKAGHVCPSVNFKSTTAVLIWMEYDTGESHGKLSSDLNFCSDQAVLTINLHEGLPLIVSA